MSAFIQGPLFSTYGLRDYFSDTLFRQYLLNIIGDIHFYLPGLFESNPYYPLVNAQLWTVPFELLCYAALAGLAVIGLKRYRVIGLLAPIALALAYYVTRVYRHGGDIPGHATAVNGPFLVISFLCGVAIYLYKEKIPWSGYLFAAGAAASIYILSNSIDSGSFLDYVAPFPLAYCTVYLGLTDAPRVGALKSADYSYGIFLYHFAVQQTVMQMTWARHWYLNLLICLPLTVALAAASWHFVEKPMLRFRKFIDDIEDRYLGSAPRRAEGLMIATPITTLAPCTPPRSSSR
jgi:peptidoglycan/LPS O-acetylase OafA/YrhL